jgi:hypothetical protein
MRPENLLLAARAEAIPEGWEGLWFIQKTKVKMMQITLHNGEYRTLPAGVYTALFRMTDSTMHRYPPGEVVMEDTPFELRTHLTFMLKAGGNVLVTGLGLGCVVRGLLANPAVDHITCIEKSQDVLRLVQPHMPKTDRLAIIHADALEWTATTTQTFDYAWHDLWTNRDVGEPSLDEWHTRLILNCRHKAKKQGAWKYSRIARSLFRVRGVNLIA